MRGGVLKGNHKAGKKSQNSRLGQASSHRTITRHAHKRRRHKTVGEQQAFFSNLMFIKKRGRRKKLHRLLL